jgi:hypothetical protein
VFTWQYRRFRHAQGHPDVLQNRVFLAGMVPVGKPNDYNHYRLSMSHDCGVFPWLLIYV